MQKNNNQKTCRIILFVVIKKMWYVFWHPSLDIYIYMYIYVYVCVCVKDRSVQTCHILGYLQYCSDHVVVFIYLLNYYVV